MFSERLKSLLTTLSLLVITNNQPIIDNINPNYFAHSESEIDFL
jgi:hypothetical protein